MEPTPSQHTRRRTVIMTASSTEILSKRETSAIAVVFAAPRATRATSTLARAPTTRLPRALRRALHANDGADHLAGEVTGAARFVDAHRAQEGVEHAPARI